MKTFTSTVRPEWMADAACIDHHPDLWYAPTESAAVRAKQVCTYCPVIDLCLRWALDSGEPEGIWGGKTFKERVNLRRVEQYNAKKESAA